MTLDNKANEQAVAERQPSLVQCVANGGFEAQRPSVQNAAKLRKEPNLTDAAGRMKVCFCKSVWLDDSACDRLYLAMTESV